MTATMLARCGDNGTELSPFAPSWMEQSGLLGSDLAIRGLVNDPALPAFALIVLIVVLRTISDIKIDFGNDN